MTEEPIARQGFHKLQLQWFNAYSALGIAEKHRPKPNAMMNHVGFKSIEGLETG